MKLIVQIPCLNEEATLPETIHDIPRNISGIDAVEILVIDDGSQDNTIRVAKDCGVDHIIKLTNRKGLAKAFAAGVDACLKNHADIIVNTDADNQYAGGDIEKLIQPILSGKADMVIGVRDIDGHKEFSWIKKRLQHLGSWVVSKLSGVKISDTTSGFRAYNAYAAAQINILSDYSYTLETIIQAGRLGMAVNQVEINTNPKTRPSRLFRSTVHYVIKSILTIARVYAIYQPLRVFVTIGTMFFLPGAIAILRFVCLYSIGQGGGHIQSLILGSVLTILGFQIYILGLVANLIAANRFLIEKTLNYIKTNKTK